MVNKWKKHIRVLAAFMLGIAAVHCIPGESINAVDISDDATYILDIELAGDDTGYLDDLNNADVTVDFYRVATLIPDPKYDTYSFNSLINFSVDGEAVDLSKYDVLSKLDAEKWDQLSAQAAEKVLPDGTGFEKASTDSDSIALKPGLWLVVPHDTAEINAEDKDLPEGVISLVHTPRYTYVYRPQLIAVPTTDNGSTDGTWQSRSTATLKPERLKRYAKILVTKDLLKYETTTEATFVFEVKASYNQDMSDPVYNNVVALTFSAAESQTHLFDDIPADTYVQVTETYNGSSYTKTYAEEDIRHIDAYVTGAKIQKFKFENSYDKPPRSGSGINNHFDQRKDDPAKWSWNKEYKTGDYEETTGGTEQ